MVSQLTTNLPLMVELQDIIELRFFGGGVTPETVRVKELVELITSFEDSLLATVLKDNPEVDSKDIYISLVEIKDESEGLRFLPNLKEIMVPAFLAITSALSTSNFDQLSNRALEKLSPIHKFIKERNCEAEFKLNSQTLATIGSDYSSWTKAAIAQRRFTYGETVVYAQVLRTGGKRPTVALQIRGIHSLFFLEVSQIMARNLGTKLYETVKLLVDARWEIGSYQLIDFKIKEILDFESPDASEGFEELRNELSKYWDTIDNINEVLYKEPSVEG